MKTKVDSVHYLALLTILGLMLFAGQGHAAEATLTDSVATADSTASDSQDSSRGDFRDRKADFRRPDRHRQDKKIFYLGVCSGQVLAKQGTYFSDIESGATTATVADLKAAIKAAIQTCKEQAKSSQNNGVLPSVSPTPVPSATPVPAATPIPTTTTTASD